MSVIFLLLHVNGGRGVSNQTYFYQFDGHHFCHLQVVVKRVGELLMSAQLVNNSLSLLYD